MNKHLFLGFSLTEVLIAMTVIGIISAITVPVVIGHYQKQSLLSLIQKNYSDMEQNLTILQTENYSKGLYHSILNQKEGKTVENTAGQFLTEYYKVKKDCGTTAQPCFAAAYRDISTGTATNFSCAGYTISTNNGTAICIIPANIAKEIKEGETEETETKNPAKVFIDINGTEDPNISGRDLFTFNIYEDFTIDEVDPTLSSSDKTAKRTEVAAKCITSKIGEGCLSRLLNDNWKMNY